MRIIGLVWDDFNQDHIAAHNVEPDEVEEIVFGYPFTKKGRGEDRYFVYGQTDAGRYLTIIADHEGSGWFYVVTARNMTQKERRAYRKAKGRA